MHKVEFLPEVMQRVMARQGKPLAFERFEAPKTALIVVDMQNYYMKPGMPTETPVARAIVPNINRLAGALRDAGGLVVWVSMAAPENCAEHWPSLRAISTDASFTRRQGMLSAGAEAYAIWPDLDVREADMQFVKYRYSAFINASADLEATLRGRGIDTVLITGVATNVCCESTARDAMMLNFNTVMVSDGLAAKTDAMHNATLATFYMHFGDVQTTDQVIDGLGAANRSAAE